MKTRMDPPLLEEKKRFPPDGWPQSVDQSAGLCSIQHT